ncbi:alpha/beta fold hydrolase [Marimonas lutisalis]|uniref:alpha/beta fold hydrolase n=1 Tax=Marimonas lutisalis TaxID=2545756 RepID=UPI0010FA4D66|nr:alpha/beta fold hydrolase [Marimonas lutisalis]
MQTAENLVTSQDDHSIIGYNETGDGQPILFVPGSFSTAQAWRGFHNHLGERFHCVSTCLRGYGETPETRSRDDFGIEHEISIIRDAAERIGKPVHLVGHSFGATVALAAALEGAVDALSITTFEANPITLLGAVGRQDLQDTAIWLTAQLEAAHDRGDAEACSLVIDFWGQSGTFASMPEPFRAYCREKTFTNILDWRSARSLEASALDYSRLNTPVLLVRGEHANPVMMGVTSALEKSLPNARTEVVADAGHFLISTHVNDCIHLLECFLSEFADKDVEREATCGELSITKARFARSRRHR